VMVEALAAGSPVIAMNMGSVPEVIADGQVGFVCDTVDECVASVARLSEISRSACRQHVQDNFSAQSMTAGYEAVYTQMLAKRFSQNGHRQLVGASR
jgi:glycosyltransferase involved in cell wall biosynthesis